MAFMFVQASMATLKSTLFLYRYSEITPCTSSCYILEREEGERERECMHFSAVLKKYLKKYNFLYIALKAICVHVY